MSATLRLSVLAAAITSVLSPVQAAETETTNLHKKSKDIITVYATGNERDSFEAPMMVTVIKNNSPQTQTANTANDILKKVPGIDVSGTGRTNGQDVSMRGFGPKDVLTLVDNVRQGTDTGHINGTFIDPALIKQVEIIRGPSALLYGSGAMGGVIAWETVDAKDLLKDNQNLGFRVFTTAATGDHSFGFGGSAFGRNEKFDGLFSFVAKDVGNIRQGGGEETTNDETISNLLVKGSWLIDDSQKLSGQLRYYNNDAYEPKNPQQVKQNDKSNPETNRTTRQRDTQLTYQLKPADQDWLNLKTTAYYSDVNITARPTAKAINTGYEGRQQKTYGLKVDNRSNVYNLPIAAHNLTYGAETYQQKQDPFANTTSFPNAKITYGSGFLQDEITLKDLPISFIAGTRYDHFKSQSDGNNSITANNWSSKGAVSITPTDWSMLFASYSEAFRAPSMGEMYNDAKHFEIRGRVNYWVPNPQLKPESTQTKEYGFGLRFDNLLLDNDGLQFKASYFDTKAKDYIDTYVDMAKMTTQSVNIDDVKIWGVDATLSYNTDYFNWDLAYNHTASNGKSPQTGTPLTSIKPDSITSTLNVPIQNSGFAVGWIGEFTKHTDYSDSDKMQQQSGYGVSDFYLSYQGEGSLNGFGSSVVLGNAFDKQYYSSQGIPQDGRNAKLLVSYQW
ncbi:TonB-dependent hemoglobin/transferrin/lactoferrin family receptor [Moellerella wisconsensis]|uniref:TonB-dependent hemoglobin/transferrin/lactoferrin family receptor n=1 Tax=Moellerella wisconsensis TaxID=158849 RepID=UPI000640CB8C|nr:TonB-dependent hemoglobin/transferrin/lactoferrin family receptor [Moellerella wisconsensis]KLN97254.1 ligand-gated channel protein [Moellerella wisconsensis]